jgi:hypothetical protein
MSVLVRSLLLWAGLGLAAWLGPARPIWAQPPADARLTYHARRALDQDETLGQFNIGVVVRDGVATLIGKLPNVNLVRRAENCVQQVPGLRGLRNELLVGPPAEPPPIRMPAAPAPPSPPRDETVSLFAPIPAPDAGDGPRGPALVLLAPLVGDSQTPTPQAQRPSALTSQGLLPVEPLRPFADSDLVTAVERLRWSDPRFQRVRVEVRQGRVFLSGAVVRAEDGMDLARLASHLPGVAGVVLQTREAALLPGRTP